MPSYEGWVDPGFEKDLARFSEEERAKILDALRPLAADPFANANVETAQGSRWPGSVRVRIGPFRVLALVLPKPKVILFTVAFRKKRDADYAVAIGTHDKRVAAQGPPVDKFLQRNRDDLTR